MMTYLGRVLKYIVKLTILAGMLLAVMLLTKTTYVDPKEILYGFFSSQRGVLLIVALLAIAFTYPFFGFVKRDISGSFDDHTETIINIMAIGGYKLESNQGGVMIFRADSKLARFLKLWDDQVKIYGDNRFITLEGNRKEVSKAEYRLKSYIR